MFIVAKKKNYYERETLKVFTIFSYTQKKFEVLCNFWSVQFAGSTGFFGSDSKKKVFCVRVSTLTSI